MTRGNRTDALRDAVNGQPELCAGFVLIVLIQVAAITSAAWMPGQLAWSLGAGIIATLIVAISTVAGSRRRREAYSAEREARLARWLEEIDLDSAAVAPADADDETVLVDAVEQLGGRVRVYRKKLLIRHQRIQRLLRNVTDVLYQTDAFGGLTWVTQSVADILGYQPVDMVDRPLRDFLADPEQDFALLVESPQLTRHPVRMLCKDGQIAWLMVSSRRIDGPDGNRTGTEGIWRDGTRLIETQRALDQEKERAQVTLASIGDGVITTDAQGQVDYLNPSALGMLGVSCKDALGQGFDTLCRLTDTAHDAPLVGIVKQCVDAGRTLSWEDNIVLGDREGAPLGPAVKLTVSPIRGRGRVVVGTVVAMHDITRLQQIAREMSYQANHDLVTGLANRRAFEARLTETRAHARDSGQTHALCYLDLDQFKLVNDTCGHDAGDEMLVQIGELIQSWLRPTDTLARLGGDEFGIIMHDLSSADAVVKADQLRCAIDRFRFHWQDKLFRLGVSIGLATIDCDALSMTELLRRADTACYMAKEKGRNQVCVYRRGSDETQIRHGDMQRMQQISDALENDRFTLFAQIMQPLAHARDERLGVELLLRLRQPGGRYLTPGQFLITAERYHAAPRIDRWVLEEALRLIASADHHHGRIDHYSINISAQSICDAQFVNAAVELIGSSGVDPGALVFEITETAAVSNTRRAADLIRSLRALGCRFSLDDFGSGLSSFAYLKDLPLDFIKIDGKLVREILRDPVEASIVQSIKQIGNAIGLKTVAEHVENPAVLEALRDMGVDYAQGYHVADPVAFDRLDELIRAGVQSKPTLVKR